MIGQNVAGNYCRNTATMIAVMVFLLFFGCAGWCQDPGSLIPKKEKPSATVKVEVKDSETKEPAQVKVEVSGKGIEAKAGEKKDESSSKGRQQPEERITPISTEKIEEAGKKVGEKLDEVARKSSSILGNWITATAFHGITWLKLTATILMLLAVFVIDRTLSHFIRRQLRRTRPEQPKPTWFDVLLDALSKPLSLFIWIYGSYFALSSLFVYFDIPFDTNVVKDYAGKVADIGGLIAFVWLIFRVIRLVDLELGKRAKSPESRMDDLQATLVGKTLRWIIVIAGTLVIIHSLTGIQAGPLIASLGIGGLAVALAAKESIANLFGTVTIVFDRPFKVGDRIAIDKYDGFVESVGYRSTKLRLWSGNLVNIPNEKVISSSVENYARRPHIRWYTNITITYDTPPDKVDRAVALIGEILAQDQDTSREWPPWVFFDGFNDWSLNIRVMAWFKGEAREPGQFDYYTWRQRNCRKILRTFNEHGIQFAFPTGTTYLANDEKRQLKLMMLGGEEPGGD